MSDASDVTGPDEEQLLAAAQKRLEDRRRDLEQERAVEAAREKDLARAQGGRVGALKPLDVTAAVGDRVTYAGPRPRRPFLGPVPGSALPLLYVVPPPDAFPSDASERLQMLLQIPEKFREVAWSNIASLTYDRVPSLGTVETRSGRRLRGEEAAADVQRRIGGSTKVVLLGESGGGKTLCAAAALRAAIEAGASRARWVHADSLKEPGAVDRAVGASILVVDDLGFELKGAKAGSGWVPSLSAPAYELFGRWDQLRNRRLIVTTFLDYDAMAELYGGVARRVYEGADVIRFYREPS